MLRFYQIFIPRSRSRCEQVSERPQVFDADSGMIRQWHGRAGRPIKHPARRLQQLKPTIMFERGLNAHYSLSHTGPVGGHLQAELRMPTVMDLQLGTMCSVSRGCTIESGCISRSTTKPRRRFTVSRLEKRLAAIHLIFAEILSRACY
jgi:hypothetical protein